MKTHSRTTALAALILTSLLIAPSQAASKGSMKKPDFTKGDSIPEGATHDWTLGATGARGWMYSNKLMTAEARQIKITEIKGKSPSDGALEIGDVILGVSGKPFSYDPRTEFAKALTIAESEVGKGTLSLIRWRDGKQENVTITLPVLGTYSSTAPYDCPKSKKIFEQGCEDLAARMEADGYQKQSPITRSLNALALLASGERKYERLLAKEAEWASGFSANSMATWYYGYVMMFLAEYHMATGDRSVLPGLERIALEASNGQSIVGSWGHKFAGDDGRLIGYGMMNAPGIPVTTALVMARQAGVEAPEIDLAIDRSLKLLRFYAGKGSIPYGDHAPWIQTHDDNGKNGMAAVLFSLLGETETAEYFSRMSLACHGNERDTGHTGNFWNMTWAIPGVVQSGSHATGAWMEEFGAWYYDLARGSEGNFRHQGPPQMKGDNTRNWDATGAYLLAYAMPLKKLVLTGKNTTQVPQLNAEEAYAVVMDGRGWNNKDRNSAYEKLPTEILFENLGSWSPVIRKRSADALAKRRDEVRIEALVRMLNSPNLNTSYGACEALATLGGRATDAVPDLIKTLEHEDLWLRVKAAEALASIGGPAMEALPKLLHTLAKGPTSEDPRGMEQRYLSFTVFGKMLRKSIEGVNKDLLRRAVVAGLQNQDGHARSAVSGVYQKLNYEEIKPILPAIHEAVVTPAPSGIMFADGIRIAGLNLLAKHRIKEGIPLCLDVMDLQRWGKKGRIKSCLDALAKYGGAAKSELPRLREIEKELRSHRESKNLIPFAERTKQLIEIIETSKDTVELRSL